MRLVVDRARSRRRGAPRALGVSRVTADVLVRRGLADPEAARRVPRAARPAARPARPSATWPPPCDGDRGRDRRRAGAIVVHGDYDVDGICATAVATAVIAALGGDVEPFLPSRFDEGYGLAVETVERLHAAGLRPARDGRLRHHGASRRRRAAAELGLALVITDHHRPGRRAARLPAGRAARPRRLPAPSCAAPASPTSSARRSSRAPAPTRRSLERELDLVALATVADIVPLVGENRGAGARGPRRAAPHAPRRASRRCCASPASSARGPARARSASGSRRASTPPAGSATRARRSSCSRPTTRGGRGSSPTCSTPSTASGRRSRPRSCATRSPWPRRCPPSAAAPRGLVLASAEWHVGRGRHRRVAARRAPAAAGGADRRSRARRAAARAARCRRSTCTPALAACAEHLRRVRRPPRGGRRDRARRRRRRLRRPRSRRTPTPRSTTTTSSPRRAHRRGRCRWPTCRSSWPTSSRRLEPHGLGNPARAAARCRASSSAGVATLGAGGQAPALHRPLGAGTCRTVWWGAGGDAGAARAAAASTSSAASSATTGTAPRPCS